VSTSPPPLVQHVSGRGRAAGAAATVTSCRLAADTAVCLLVLLVGVQELGAEQEGGGGGRGSRVKIKHTSLRKPAIVNLRTRLTHSHVQVHVHVHVHAWDSTHQGRCWVHRTTS
jgi:hypothetical protein